jgi:hypothetical protein
VLNPEFIGRYSYGILKAQNYARFIEQVMNRPEKDFPIILYAVELTRKGSALEKGHIELGKAYQKFSVNVRTDKTLRKKVKTIRGRLS